MYINMVMMEEIKKQECLIRNKFSRNEDAVFGQ